LLLTSGFRTYRFLPVFWREFFPRYDLVTPSPKQRLLDHLASIRYGSRYEDASGVVRFPSPQRLRGSLGVIPTGRKTDAHVSFFLARNPGLAEISAENLTAAGRRMVS
jgi:hypothetical protein